MYAILSTVILVKTFKDAQDQSDNNAAQKDLQTLWRRYSVQQELNIKNHHEIST